MYIKYDSLPVLPVWSKENYQKKDCKIRTKISKERRRIMREWIWLEQEHRCFWCWKGLPIKKATLDHLLPKSHGGLDKFNNFVVSCARCNQSRGNNRAKATFLWLRTIIKCKKN